jgi:hypothetical protein
LVVDVSGVDADPAARAWVIHYFQILGRVKPLLTLILEALENRKKLLKIFHSAFLYAIKVKYPDRDIKFSNNINGLIYDQCP